MVQRDGPTDGGRQVNEAVMTKASKNLTRCFILSAVEAILGACVRDMIVLDASGCSQDQVDHLHQNDMSGSRGFPCFYVTLRRALTSSVLLGRCHERCRLEHTHHLYISKHTLEQYSYRKPRNQAYPSTVIPLHLHSFALSPYSPCSSLGELNCDTSDSSSEYDRGVNTFSPEVSQYSMKLT